MAVGDLDEGEALADIQLCAKKADAPGWVVPYGTEFWREDVGKPQKADAGHSASKLDLHSVIDRVSHAIRKDDKSGELGVLAKNFTATFDAAGFNLVPRASGAFEQRDGVRFRTLCVRQDGKLIYRASSLPPVRSAIGNTMQALLDASHGCIEHYEIRAQGVAVSWILHQPLPSTVPLTVEAELSGLKLNRQTEKGLHFTSADGKSGVRVSLAKVVDATGQEWPLDIEWMPGSEGILRVTVPTRILETVCYPLAIDPVIGPEFAIDSPVPVPGVGDQIAPALASNGSNYLVAWVDDHLEGVYADIHGTRVGLDGTILDELGLTLRREEGSQDAPTIASDGRDYLVVWRDRTTGKPEFHGRRVRGDGTLLDSNPLVIVSRPGERAPPAMASDGTNYLVVWEEQSGIPDIMAVRVSGDGVVLETNGFLICNAPDVQASPSVAWTGTEYLLVWADARQWSVSRYDLFGARVTGTGQVLTPNGFALYNATNDQKNSALACNGANCLMVWEDYLSNTARVFVARFDAGGLALPAVAIAPLSSRSQMEPAIASNGSDYLVVWRESIRSTNTMHAARVSSAGEILDVPSLTLSGTEYPAVFPAVASDGQDFLAAWCHQYPFTPFNEYEVLGAIVSNSGHVHPTNGALLSIKANAEYSPVIAFNGETYLVAWLDTRTGIYGVRLTPTGQALEPSGFLVTPTATVTPRVASNGRDFIVIWGGAVQGVSGQRITAAGEVIPLTGLQLNDFPTGYLEIASNGQDYLIVGGGNQATVFGARLAADGRLLDTNGFLITNEPGLSFYPAVGSNGRDYLATWARRAPAGQPGSGWFLIRGRRITAEGQLPDSASLLIGGYAREQWLPRVAGAGTNFLVVWTDSRRDGADIFGARVHSDGTLLDPTNILVCTATGAQDRVDVAFSGGNYFVTWQDARDPVAGQDIYGTRVSPGGEILDGAGLIVTDLPGPQPSPRIAGGLAGSFLVVYNSIQHGAYRAEGTFICSDAVTPSILPLRIIGSDVLLSWTTQPGRSYRVEYKDNLDETQWMNLTTAVSTRGCIASAIDQFSDIRRQRVYRIVGNP